jgi:AcrR family transcriptional regulator
VEQQRQRLIDAAERVFERHGWGGANVQAIVREAGMSTRSFYEFFDSKDELAVALARDRAELFMKEIGEVLRTTNDLAEAIDRILRAFLEGLPVVIIELGQLGGSAGRRIAPIRKEYLEKIGALLVRELRLLTERGVIPSAPDPMSLALVLSGIEGFTIRYHQEGRREELLKLHPTLMEALRRLFPTLLG